MASSLARLAVMSMLPIQIWAAHAAHEPAAAPAVDRPISFALHPARAKTRYLMQGDTVMDHPVGEAVILAGHRCPTRQPATGQLEIDLTGDGTYVTVRPGSMTIALGSSNGHRGGTIDLAWSRASDGTWTYRTVTELSGMLGDERVAIIDVDGDGAFDHVGVDGIVLGDGAYAFPLPASDERWCTGKLEITGLSFGPMGQKPAAVGRLLATTTPATLPVLLGINGERRKVGVTPRPEDPALSAAVQMHCRYMAATGSLQNEETAGAPGFSPDGDAAGRESDIARNVEPARAAAHMTAALYHRQDLLRSDTLAFGLGVERGFIAIDGRRILAPKAVLPILVPAPDQHDVPTRATRSHADPTPGDHDTGYPISVRFASSSAVLTTWKLELAGKSGAKSIDCHAVDAHGGGEIAYNQLYGIVGLIPKDPLQDGLYRVSMTVDVGGTPWSRTWTFTVGTPKKP
ncbi:MAG: hypothetical protein H0W83_00850 [Planctomycetes bacterium]|nr:hypothetical protein [Planctomycetota bacterium]